MKEGREVTGWLKMSSGSGKGGGGGSGVRVLRGKAPNIADGLLLVQDARRVATEQADQLQYGAG